MKNHTLVSHPLNQRFLKTLSSNSYPDSEKYYLLLAPPYANCSTDPQQYFFRETGSQLTCCADTAIILEKNSTTITYKNTDFQILTSCLETTEHGFTYALLELNNNIYAPVPIPEIATRIDNIADITDMVGQFLFSIACDKTTDIVTHISEELSDMIMTKEKFVSCVREITDLCDDLLTFLHSLPEFQQLGVYTLNRTNLAVFNFISALFHSKLFPFFTSLYLEQDQRAHNAILRWTSRHTRPPHLNFPSFANIFSEGLSTVELVNRVCLFFDELVDRVNDDHMGADKLLDILTESMAWNGRSIGQHISVFAFLDMIWPPNGLDDRIEYILTTCASAAKELPNLK